MIANYDQVVVYGNQH